MLATLIRAMEAQRAPLGDRWEALLRAESPPHCGQSPVTAALTAMGRVGSSTAGWFPSFDESVVVAVAIAAMGFIWLHRVT